MKKCSDARLVAAPEHPTERIGAALDFVKYEVNKQDRSGAASVLSLKS